jgi:hypothetical protein
MQEWQKATQRFTKIKRRKGIAYHFQSSSSFPHFGSFPDVEKLEILAIGNEGKNDILSTKDLRTGSSFLHTQGFLSHFSQFICQLEQSEHQIFGEIAYKHHCVGTLVCHSVFYGVTLTHVRHVNPARLFNISTHD